MQCQRYSYLWVWKIIHNAFSLSSLVTWKPGEGGSSLVGVLGDDGENGMDKFQGLDWLPGMVDRKG
jgi:hypothetical protein